MIDPKAALQSLEWPRFLGLAAAEAATEPGRALIQLLANPEFWARDVATARGWQQETLEVSPLLERDALWGPLTELSDPEPAIERLERGSVLETAELVLLRRWIYAIDSWSQTPRDEIRGERFKRALSLLADPYEPLRMLERVLTPEGEISERATPRLSALHAEIRGLKREIHIILDQLLKSLDTQGILQENFSDVRDGRYVIPVKISHQNDVEGIIYEASASRQTVFVEPREVGTLNNRLRQRQNDLLQEIYTVLQDTSHKLQPFAPELRTSSTILSHWDAVHARAKMGRRYGGKPIEVTEDRTFLMQATAHPLLWWSMPVEQIVRNPIDFGDPVRTLLLTGPNTGGKTVILKTLGLAGICARTGFPFSGSDLPQVPFFDSFFVDLGDPQSIEQHLSSFSGHILRFKDILEQVTERSLVLIDELNSATDPEEGAALGRAVLETLMARGALLVATTHDPHLKALAISDERILNASLAFDERARTPTYNVALGVPGRSRALETAERLGLPAEVLTLARKYLSKEHIKFEDLLGRLENDAAEATRARKEAIQIREEAERMKREWTTRTESSVNEMLERTRQRLRRILEQAQDEVRSSVRKLDEMKSRKEHDSTRGSLNQSFSTAASRIETALQEEAPELAEAIHISEPVVRVESPEQTLEVGTAVRIPKWKSTGTILELKSGKAKVAMGTIQMMLSIRDIEPLTAQERAQVASLAPKKAKVRYEDRPATPDRQIDLRGTRLEEALSKLEQYLDQAFRSGDLAQVTIIHGLGTGAIREGSRKLIASLPYIKTVRDGGAGQGGAGSTVVEFDRD